MRIWCETDIQRVKDLPMDNIEIVIDDDQPNKIEIYMLDAEGNRIEGGTFDREAFMNHIIHFYDKNY
ncbi:MAG TPA: hypothetical protein VFM18_11765 [Methanosarcina sp.]|nr:hypothetical protein [Methanosarcina sp.]